MVFRLFVPPGEGQDNLIPRRPDPIGANATLQYTVLASTGLAAAYTSLAASHQRRVRAQNLVSRTALFIRSSARFGIWAGALGAATNWYYYSAFASVAASKQVGNVKPWKLYERTKTLTVEDGYLVGALLGAAASIPTLFMRRPAIPRWTRCIGMTHIGACASILGTHGYLQYTGQRQEAYQCLERRMRRKNMELWAIFWDKELMAQFNPVVQLYVRNNGIWYASLLPDYAFQQSNDRGLPVLEHSATPSQVATATTQPTEEEQPFYLQPSDYAEVLHRIDVPAFLLEIEQLELERAALLAEGELLLCINSSNQYEYCHNKEMDEDDRRARLYEMFVLEITYTGLQRSARAIEEQILKSRLALQHRTVWFETTASNDSLSDWLPPSSYDSQLDNTKPEAAIRQVEHMQGTIRREVKLFEEWSTDVQFKQASRQKWRQDLEDGRYMLRAADTIAFKLGKYRKRVKEAEGNANHEINDKRQIQKPNAANDGREGKMPEHEAVSAAALAPKTSPRPSDDGQTPNGM